jgi:hypothetical protein
MGNTIQSIYVAITGFLHFFYWSCLRSIHKLFRRKLTNTHEIERKALMNDLKGFRTKI